MHISFDPIQNQTATKTLAQAKSQMQKMDVTAANTGIMMDAFGMKNAQGDIFSYGKEDKNKSVQDIQNQASMLNSADYKNYMAVMSHTMSEEDYKKMTEDGVHPGKTQVSDAANIMDHIKANMAEAGVVVDGFNGASDMDIETLTQITGDAGYANALANAFAKSDLPLTEENAKETMQAVNQALHITDMTDEMKQFLLSNNLPLSIDEIYKSMYSAGKVASQNQGGYFADDTYGYLGKKPEQVDTNALEKQVMQVLSQTDLEITEETKQEAFWMLEKGILLTPENMEKMSQLNKMTFPLQPEDLFQKIAGTMQEGKAALDTNLVEETLVEKAQKIYDLVQNISDESLHAVISSGKEIHIKSLSNTQKQIALSSYMENNVTKNAQSAFPSENNQDSFLHEKRMLEEVRLKMTVSANIILLKSNYSIDTAPLSDLVDALKVAEQRQNNMGLSLPEESQTKLYQETMEKRTALFDMPVAAISKVMSSADIITLRSLHEQGSILKSTYDKAGESYEALMTKPRADLGDRLKDAFGNIDELLSENNMESNEQNRRAVRILAYNQMPINEEMIAKVVQADENIRDLLLKMSPASTLKMIRDGINPLDQNIEELHQYFDQQEKDPVQQAEKYSQFLYHLEQKNEITPQERASFIGIYRLIRQIEKQDGKAIGRVVADGREMSFSNLLSAVRTGQKKPMNITIDDTSGMLSDLQTKGTNIADQINSYFDFLKESEMNSDYMHQSYQEFTDQMQNTTEYVDVLLENHQLITPDNLTAMKELHENRGQVYKGTKEKLIKEDTHFVQDEAHMTESAFDQMIEKVLDAFSTKQQAAEAIEQMSTQMSASLSDIMTEDDNQYLDIKAIGLLQKQLSLVSNMAKEENYEIPAMIEGELTSANVKFIQADAQQRPNAKINVQLSSGRQIIASFTQEEEKIKGFIGSNDETVKEELEKKHEAFSSMVLSETGKTADIQIIKGDTLSQTEQNRRLVAGKQSLLQNQANDHQGGYEDAGALYKTVRAFMRLLA